MCWACNTLCLFDSVPAICLIYTYLTVLARHHTWRNRRNSTLILPLPTPPTLLSSACIPSPLSLLLHLLSRATAIYRRPSISPACQHAFSFGLLLQGARRWQITTRQPVIFDLSEAPSHPPISHSPLQPFHTYSPHQSQSRHTAQFLITSNTLPYFPPNPALSSCFQSVRKILLARHNKT